MLAPVSQTFHVQIGDQCFAYSRRWNGRTLANRRFLAFDVETEMIGNDPSAIPRLALASVSAAGSKTASCILTKSADSSWPTRESVG